MIYWNSFGYFGFLAFVALKYIFCILKLLVCDTIKSQKEFEFEPNIRRMKDFRHKASLISFVFKFELSQQKYIWVIGTRTGKKLMKCHFFFKVRSWYGQIKAKIDIILSPSTLS